jgi:N-acetylglutamate synthase-like GNAT family acetyltransferase
MIKREDITIRTKLRQGDLAAILTMHAEIYGKEYGYNLNFEAIVAKTLFEFFELYTPERSRLWICEHEGRIVGSLALLDRGDTAQLRYFVLMKDYRGLGLGNHLMNLYMDSMRDIGYTTAYLLTTDDLHEAIHLYRKFGFELVSSTASDAYGHTLHRQRYEIRSIEGIDTPEA